GSAAKRVEVSNPQHRRRSKSPRLTDGVLRSEKLTGRPQMNFLFEFWSSDTIHARPIITGILQRGLHIAPRRLERRKSAPAMSDKPLDLAGLAACRWLPLEATPSIYDKPPGLPGLVACRTFNEETNNHGNAEWLPKKRDGTFQAGWSPRADHRRI